MFGAELVGEGGQVVEGCVGRAGGRGVGDVEPGGVCGCAGGEGEGARVVVVGDLVRGGVAVEVEEELEEG